MDNLIKENNVALTVALLILLGIFAVSIVFGNTLHWGDNWFCSTLGCNYGYFGYDTLVQHFLSGVLGVVFLFWLVKTFPRLKILNRSSLKNLLIILAVVGFFGILWEVVEYVQDLIRIRVFNLDLLDSGTRIHLAQASFADTIGDIIFDMLGGVVGFSLAKLISHDSAHKKRA